MHFSDTLENVENALDENARERARFSLFQRLFGRISSDIVRFLFVRLYEWMNECKALPTIYVGRMLTAMMMLMMMM